MAWRLLRIWNGRIRDGTDCFAGNFDYTDGGICGQPHRFYRDGAHGIGDSDDSAALQCHHGEKCDAAASQETNETQKREEAEALEVIVHSGLNVLVWGFAEEDFQLRSHGNIAMTESVFVAGDELAVGQRWSITP